MIEISQRGKLRARYNRNHNVSDQELIDLAIADLAAQAAEIERLSEQRSELCADIPTITHTSTLPQYDPVWVRTLLSAYKEALAEIERLKNG